MLTADGSYTLQTGTKTQHDAAATLTITVNFDKAANAYTCYVQAIYGGTVEGGYVVVFTKAELIAFTASGADEILKAFNQCEQAVKDDLEAFAENSGVTFTIS